MSIMVGMLCCVFSPDEAGGGRDCDCADWRRFRAPVRVWRPGVGSGHSYNGDLEPRLGGGARGGGTGSSARPVSQATACPPDPNTVLHSGLKLHENYPSSEDQP